MALVRDIVNRLSTSIYPEVVTNDLLYKEMLDINSAILTLASQIDDQTNPYQSIVTGEAKKEFSHNYYCGIAAAHRLVGVFAETVPKHSPMILGSDQRFYRFVGSTTNSRYRQFIGVAAESYNVNDIGIVIMRGMVYTDAILPGTGGQPPAARANVGVANGENTMRTQQPRTCGVLISPNMLYVTAHSKEQAV